MEQKFIQTLHPIVGKINKKILKEKYDFIKENMLQILHEKELTHTELMEELYTKVNGNFNGGVQWYGETVKLDLEARLVIERTNAKPEKYKIKPNNII
jgi:uncharacterized FlgJ-related protein